MSESATGTYLCFFDLFTEFLRQLLVLLDLFGKRDLDAALTLLELFDLGQSGLQ